MVLIKANHPILERHVLRYGGMGSVGKPDTHVSHKYSIGIGDLKKGHFEAIMSIPSFIEATFIPQQAKDKLASFAKENNFTI